MDSIIDEKQQATGSADAASSLASDYWEPFIGNFLLRINQTARLVADV